MDNILACVLDIPIIVPDDWDIWWKLWNNHAAFMKKTTANHNTGASGWKGIEIYRGPAYEGGSIYDVKFIDCEVYLPKMIDIIKSIPFNITSVWALESFRAYAPHHDFSFPAIQCRVLLHDENPKKTFYYIINGRKVYQQLPKNSNTWIYSDDKILHGSDYNPKFKKILFAIFGEWKSNTGHELVLSSIEKYPDFVLTVDK